MKGHQDGVVAIAAPILTANGRPAGSLSISAPKSRMPKAIHADCGRRVRATAESIAAALPRHSSA